jgi:hypothetical protein
MQNLLDEETKAAIRGQQKGNREEAMKKRLTGEDDLTKLYMGKMKSLVRILFIIRYIYIYLDVFILIMYYLYL